MQEYLYGDVDDRFFYLFKFNITTTSSQEVKRWYRKIGNANFDKEGLSYVVNCNFNIDPDLCTLGLFETVIITEKDGKYYLVSDSIPTTCSELSLQTAEDLSKMKEVETILTEEDEYSPSIKYSDRCNFFIFKF